MLSVENLGPALRRLRHARGLRQYQVAERAQVTKAMISSYELGRQTPAVPSLLRVLGALDAGLAELEAAMEPPEKIASDWLVKLQGLPPAPAGASEGPVPTEACDLAEGLGRLLLQAAASARRAGPRRERERPERQGTS